MTTNNDTAAILTALESAGLEIPELEWDETPDRTTLEAEGAYGIYRCKFAKMEFYPIIGSGFNLHERLVNSFEFAKAAANAHNRKLVAGMLRVKEAK